MLRALQCIALLCLVPGFARSEGDPDQPDWRDRARAAGFSAEDIDRLDKTKLLIAGREYRQVFEPYNESEVPTFVTADSVLNAYHVLFEESVIRLERARVSELAEILKLFWNGIPAATKQLKLEREMLDDVTQRAQVLIGVALRLLGEETPGVSDEISRQIEMEVARVSAAKERLRPEWLGPADAGSPFIDYARFEPRGFYTRDPRLAAYFRATAWLQEIPLRLAQERELFTALLLFESLDSDTKTRRYRTFVGAWKELLGESGDIELEERVSVRGPWTQENVATYRRYCEQSWKDRNSPKEGTSGAADPLHGIEPGMRVLPARSLPDGKVFDRWCDPKAPKRRVSGLLTAAALGGGFARREALSACAEGEAKSMGAAIDGDGSLTTGDSLYARYLRCISALLDPAEPDAPPVFASEEWQRKSTNAALAGWAQLRHTWVLQAREDREYLSMESTVAGFVEPDPEFFSRLAGLIEASFDLFDDRGAFDEALSRREFQWLLGDYANFLRAGGGAKTRRSLESDHSQLALVDRGAWFVKHLGGPKTRDFEETMTADDVKKSLEIVDDSIRRLDGVDPLPERLAQCVAGNVPPFRQTWRKLERLCRQLEAMAHKQLRGKPWDEDERKLLLDYGHVLAAAMFYGGNAYLSPRDDAPRVSSVYADFRDPASPSYFQVGIARPRALYIVYPAKDGDVLCRGAVMPYREFSGDKRLTDAEWKDRLDSKDAPSAPTWMEAISSPTPSSRPK